MQYCYKFLQENSPPVGLEPTIFGLEVQRVIHYAMRATQAKANIHEQPTTIPIENQKDAHRGARTHDHQLKRLALYRLS
jgi:hypothetical protein